MNPTMKKIMAKTKRKPISCKCEKCKRQCQKAPCLGTPDDIEKLIDAGYGAYVYPTIWGTGVVLGIHDRPIEMYQLLFDNRRSACVMFVNGLCKLHESGLKPTEGKLSYHTILAENYSPTKQLSVMVAKEWVNPKNRATVERIRQKMDQCK